VPLKQPALRWVLTTETEQATQSAGSSQPVRVGAGRSKIWLLNGRPDRRESGDPRAEEGNQTLPAAKALPE
jgi:hypothetical protein